MSGIFGADLEKAVILMVNEIKKERDPEVARDERRTLAMEMNAKSAERLAVAMERIANCMEFAPGALGAEKAKEDFETQVRGKAEGSIAPINPYCNVCTEHHKEGACRFERVKEGEFETQTQSKSKKRKLNGDKGGKGSESGKQ